MYFRAMSHQHVYKIIYLFLAVQWSKTQVVVMVLLFETRCFYFYLSYDKNDIFGILRQNGQGRYVLKRNL